MQQSHDDACSDASSTLGQNSPTRTLKCSRDTDRFVIPVSLFLPTVFDPSISSTELLNKQGKIATELFVYILRVIAFAALSSPSRRKEVMGMGIPLHRNQAMSMTFMRR